MSARMVDPKIPRAKSAAGPGEKPDRVLRLDDQSNVALEIAGAALSAQQHDHSKLTDHLRRENDPESGCRRPLVDVGSVHGDE